MNGRHDSWPAETAILVPAYKAEESLSRFLPQLCGRVPAEQVLVVDDGSGDGTGAACAAAGIASIAHERNQGKGAALRTGFARLMQEGFEWVITMDADGQHLVEDLDRFLEATAGDSTTGMYIGRRCMRPGIMPRARILSNRITSAILSAMVGQRIADSQCGYRAYRLRAVAGLCLRYPRFEMESEVIMRVCRRGLAVKFLPIHTVYSASHSHISHVRDTIRWVRAVVSVGVELRRSAGAASPRNRETHA